MQLANKNYISFQIKAIFAWILLLSLTSCSEEIDVETPIDITLAAEMSLLPATVWVAESKGFFTKHKINLTIKEFDSGRNALEVMLKDNSIDMATVAQTPIVFNSFNNEPYVIVATMAYSLDDIKVLARKDSGIEDAKDVIGKKVGATKRSTGHYFLESYLSHYDISLQNIDLKDVNASQLKTKLISGELDAITSWEPHIHDAQMAMSKNNLTLLISPTPLRKDFFFPTSRLYAKENSMHVNQFLKAILEAEHYIKQNPDEAKKIIAKRLKADLTLIKRIWHTFTFEISLEQSILVNLENEAIWAKKLTVPPADIPNYLNYIDFEPLQAVKPFGVNIIH